MRTFRFLAALLTLAASLPALAATLSSSADVAHLHVQLVLPNDQLYPGGRNQIGLYFKLEPGWHVYWQNAGDSGEPPRIQWTLPAGVTADPMEFPAPQRLPLGPLMDFGYQNEVLFPVHMQVALSVKDGPALLHAKVNWLVCREVCIPGHAELELGVHLVPHKPEVISGSGMDSALMARLAATLPTVLPATDRVLFQPTDAGFRLGVWTGQREAIATFFPLDQDLVSNPAPQKAIPTANGVVVELKKDPSASTTPAQLKGVLELSGGRNYLIAASRGVVAVPRTFAPLNLLRIVLLAFLGGLLLNLMPCVFPVLFLKGLALVRSGSEQRHALRMHGIVYTTGIVLSFWALVAALLGLRAAGTSLGWGFQFQSPAFVALMASLLFFLGLSLAGQFEIGLSLTSAGGGLAARQGYTGSFFTGVLAVIVATPCTAPFMGAAVGYALTQPAAVTFAVFTALAVGLATPYVALTLQPAWTRWLPRPGVWMEVLKQAVSVPIFFTVIWLAWVLAAYGANLLAALLCGLLLLAVAGWFLGRWPGKRWATVVAALLALSVTALCILAPSRLADTAPQKSVPNSSGQGMWQPWSQTAVQRALTQGRPVFVDFTAKWCLSCQVNERAALTRPEVQAGFTQSNVALFKADWTQHDDAITQELASLGRDAVPTYALYSPGQSVPQLLPEVLTPGIVLDALQKMKAKNKD